MSVMTERPPRDSLFRALSEAPMLRRSSDDDPAKLPTLTGHFVVFNEWAEVESAYEGHFMEMFAPRSFAKTIAENRARIRCVFNHGRDPSIGDKVLGPVEALYEDGEIGVLYDVPLLDTNYNRELIPGLEAGLYGCSFRFKVMKEDFVLRPRPSEANPDGLPERIVREAFLREFGPTTFGVYPNATSGLRSITDDYVRGHSTASFGGIVQASTSATPIAVVGENPPEVVVSVPAFAGDASEIADAVQRHLLERRDSTGALETDRVFSDRLYERSLGYASNAVWAIEPNVLATIVGILGERANGNWPSDAELRARLGLPDGVDPERAAEDDAPKAPVSVIRFRGPIVPHAGMIDRTSSELASVEGLRAKLRAALDDSETKAILFDIDSPGGDASLIQEFGDEIRNARGEKPIWGIANTFAASAAYWLLSQMDEAVVTPSGYVGSIGVYTVHEDISEQLKQDGVNVSIVSSGKYKVERNPFEPLGEAAREEMQRKMDAVYATFLSAVAKGRETDVATVRSDFGEGRLVMPADAVKAGMVDRVASFDATLERLIRETSRRGATIPARSQEPEPSEATTPPEPEPSAATTPDVPVSTTEVLSMRTIEELRARQEEIAARLKELHVAHGTDELPAEAKQEWLGLVAERDQNDGRISEYEGRLSDLAASAPDPERREHGSFIDRSRNAGRGFVERAGTQSRVPSNPFDLDSYRSLSESPAELRQALRDGALQVVESATFAHEEADQEKAKERIAWLLDRELGDTEEQSVVIGDAEATLANRILITGSPVYRRAFAKSIAGKGLSSEEERALSLTTTAGGFAVPYVLDPTIILTSNGAVNPLRAISRVETITTNEWRGVSSAGVTASYAAEASEAGDNAPTLAQPVANPERAQAFVPYSIEIGQDWGTLQSEMARLFSDAKDVLEADKFLTGLGHAANEPEGLYTGATAVVLTAAATTLAQQDIYNLLGSLPVRFDPRAVLLGNKLTFNRVRTFDTGGGGGFWANLAQGRPNAVTDYPIAVASGAAGGTTLVSGASILTVGDFTNFLIVDRVGMTVELLPHLLGPNRRPTGQRGLYAYWRNTSKVLAWQAFRTLKVT